MTSAMLSPTLPELLAHLTNRDYRIRKQAVREIAASYPAQAVSALLPVLKDSRSELRALVVNILGNSRDVSVVDSLCETLADKNVKVRINAIRALEKLADRRAVPALLCLLNDANRDICIQAIWALGHLGDSAVVPLLIPQLATTDRYELRTVVEALGHLADERAIVPLLAALERVEMQMQVGYLGGALGNFEKRQFSPYLEAFLADHARSTAMRASAAWLLGYLVCASALPVLLETLGDQNADVRYRVVGALASLRDRRAIGPLMKLLEDEDTRVRLEVRRTLTVLRAPGIF
ncbi:MAG TPA: HEAT repeat domain-containing protein [Ktedonobacteraceae bacterium]|jgi:HEAT repeat protein|nr:HEAT repeat domain-containing protein [Ktedonobacteraceae bacterium]